MAIASVTSSFFKCPYCGHNNRIVVKDNLGWEVMYCDQEDGGCDQPITIRYEVDVLVTPYKIVPPETKP